MNCVVHPVFRFAGLFPAIALILAGPLRSADIPSTAPASAAVLTAEQKTSLDVLDGAIARFQVLLDRDDDAQHKAATQTTLNGFKQRRVTLGQTYDQGHYDELRVDLNLEYQRLASWMRPPRNPPAEKPPATTPAAGGT